METNQKRIIPDSREKLVVDEANVGKRLDKYLTEQLPLCSRSYLQQLIKDDYIKVNDAKEKPSLKLEEGDVIDVHFPPAPDKTEVKQIVDDLGARIRFEHDDFFIVYKPSGIPMHAAHTHDTTITLVDWLLSQFQQLEQVGDHERPGIVHRLDKYTSGLLIVPRNNVAHARFSDMFKERQIKKTYQALVSGHPYKSGSVDKGIANHPSHTKMMAVDKDDPRGRPAYSEYEVLEYFDDASLVEVKPQSGRTHQIRVHMAAIKHPLLGDIVYGSPSKVINRQGLHASGLEFEYEGQSYSFKEELPDDMQQAIKRLK